MGNKLTIVDVVALAKAGYKPADVKELITLSETAEQSKQEEPQGAAPAIDEPKSASPEPKGAPENAEPAKPEETVDYKKLYEQSQEDLKKAQAANIKKDSSAADQGKDPVKDLTDLVASYL